MAENNLIQPYIKHDDNASQDGKILRMCLEFRRNAKSMSREELETFVSHGAYAIFWRILEFMKSDNLYVDDVELLSDNLRVDARFINQILNDFELFRVQNGEYVSDRLLRDIKRQREKSEKASKSANTKYLLSDFDKNYEDVFGKKPILSSEEIEALKKYSSQIEDLREKLPDLIYTLKGLKFETDTKFIPTANWLLKGNNLLRLYNGEFGKLKHKKTTKEIEEEQKKALEKQAEQSKDEIEFATQINSICNKSDAIAFIAKRIPHNADGRLFINPSLKPLCEKFDIIDREIKDFLNEQEEVF